MANVVIDGIEYAPVVRAADTAPAEQRAVLRAAGTRAVVVVDRGWIFAGDVTREGNRIFLDNAVWVFRWESIGFDGVIANPKDKKVTLRKMKNRVEIPAQSEIFSVPVSDDWGV